MKMEKVQDTQKLTNPKNWHMWNFLIQEEARRNAKEQ